MTIKSGMLRMAIFIDGSFLFHHAQSLGIRIDYRELIRIFRRRESLPHHIIAATYFTALPKETDMEEKHRNFLKVLRRDIGIQVKSVPLLRHHGSNGGNSYSKGEDILLACNMVRGALLDHYDVAILASGDGDFVPAVNMVQDAGKRIRIAAFESSLSTSLREEANDVILLDDSKEYLDLSHGESTEKTLPSFKDKNHGGG